MRSKTTFRALVSRFFAGGFLFAALVSPAKSQTRAEQMRKLLEDFFKGGPTAEQVVNWEALTLPGFEWGPTVYQAMDDAHRAEYRKKILGVFTKAAPTRPIDQCLRDASFETEAGNGQATFPSPYNPARLVTVRFGRRR